MRFGGEARAAPPPDCKPSSAGSELGAEGAFSAGGGTISGVGTGRGGSATGRGASGVASFSASAGFSTGFSVTTFGVVTRGGLTTGGLTTGGGGRSLFGAVFGSGDESLVERSGKAGAGGMLAGFAVPSAGAGTDSRRGFGGGASFFPSGGIEPRLMGGAGSLPGSSTGDGIGVERISGRLRVPGGGRLGVPTGTTGTLGIFAGGGRLSDTEVAASAVTSAASVVELSGFEVMLV